MNSADPAVVIAQVLGIFIGVTLANALAPHVVIIAAGAVGSTFGLMGWRQCTRMEAFGYVLAFTAASWLFAGSAASLVADWWHISEPTKLFAPCAAGIGWIGHRWERVGEWAGGVLRSVIERKAQ